MLPFARMTSTGKWSRLLGKRQGVGVLGELSEMTETPNGETRVKELIAQRAVDYKPLLPWVESYVFLQWFPALERTKCQ